jgi:hypothetical protein
MISNTLAIVAILIFIVLIVVTSVRTTIGKMKAQPGYTHQGELDALCGVIATAFQAKGILGTVGWRSVNSLEQPYRDLWYLHNRIKRAKLLCAVLTREDIVLIAPFVERWLARDLPHLLSAEYDDEMGVPLRGYKARMQANGLWPRAA